MRRGRAGHGGSGEPDLVLARLNALGPPDLRFEPATDAVLGGHDLQASGNRAYGTQVHIGTGAPPSVDRQRILVGRCIAVGAVERHPGGTVRCFVDGEEVVVAAFDARGGPRGRWLRHRPADPARLVDGALLDEALFAWLGPAEDYGTPWSDSSPAVCQVVTIHRLRAAVGA